MDATARAGIDINGSVLRYAEVEQYGHRYRLLRLGACDFDFDVGEAVWKAARPDHLTTVAEALADVFTGSVATSFQVTLHPPGAYSFFTPLPGGTPDAERKARLQQEATLLAGAEPPLRLTADAIYSEYVSDEERVDWVHVLALPEQIHARFDRMMRALPQTRHRLMSSMQAAATAVARLRRQQGPGADPEARFSLAVGWYPSYVEYALCQEHRWYFSHFTAAGPDEDAVYYALALLQRLGVPARAVGQVYVYGTALRPGALPLLERVLGQPPQRLNPLAVVDLDPGSLTTDFDAEAYVPCMGAAF